MSTSTLAIIGLSILVLIVGFVTAMHRNPDFWTGIVDVIGDTISEVIVRAFGDDQ